LKFTSLGVFAVLAVFVTSGCAVQEEAPPTDEVVSSEAPAGEEESSDGVEVDQGLFNVEVTLPAGFFEGQSEENIAANAEKAGYSSFAINANGSVTYTMSKAAYDTALQEMRDGTDEAIQDAVNQNPDVFTSITYNSSMTTFDVTVNRAAYDGSMEAGMIGFTLGMSGMFYQMFEGVPTEDQQVLTNFIDASTNEVFDTQKWPFEE